MAAIVSGASAASCFAQERPSITIRADKPYDLPPKGSRPQHTLTEASVFAWQQFIALTWPAKAQDGTFGSRDEADTTRRYGQKGSTGQVVWETFRHKVEAFPGQGDPNGYVNDPSTDYGYDAGIRYVYPPNPKLPASGEVEPATGQPATDPPANNLDEVNEILLCNMHAGISQGRVLYEARVNRELYRYVAEHGLWQQTETLPGQMRANTAFNLTVDDPANLKRPFIDLPSSDPSAQQLGSIEIKAAFRKLAEEEDADRFYTNRIRYYVEEGDEIRYKEEEWALIALHIIHKTESSPAFVYTSFGHIDNILDTEGERVEEPDGLIKSKYRNQTPFLPELAIEESIPGKGQEVSIVGTGALPGDSKQLYYQNIGAFKHGITVPVGINRRLFEISSEVRAVNRAAHRAIQSYDEDAVWRNYKLVNVQSQTLPSFVDRADVDNLSLDHKASYYMANIVVETNVPLQQFSGGLSPGDTAMGFERAGNTDFFLASRSGRFLPNASIRQPRVAGEPIANTFVRDGAPAGKLWRRLNMGGCLGCHGGQGQTVGGDFSVLVARGRTLGPETPDEEGTMEFNSNRLMEFMELQSRSERTTARDFDLVRHNPVNIDSNAASDQPRYDEEGKLIPPTLEEYRKWVFVGASLGLGYSDDATGITKEESARNQTQTARAGNFHNVYINPSAFKHFSDTGKFPQKTVLVMDVFEAKQKEPQGVVDRGHFPGTRLRFEVAVKNKDRPDGSDTDWAYYTFFDNTPSHAAPNASCYDCHKKHADTDNVWTQFYPILRDK